MWLLQHELPKHLELPELMPEFLYKLKINVRNESLNETTGSHLDERGPLCSKI